MNNPTKLKGCKDNRVKNWLLIGSKNLLKCDYDISQVPGDNKLCTDIELPRLSPIDFNRGSPNLTIVYFSYEHL